MRKLGLAALILTFGILILPWGRLFGQGTHSISFTITPAGTISQAPTSYIINRGLAAGQEVPSYATISANGLAPVVYKDTNGVGGTTYFYTVTTMNSSGRGPTSNEVSGTFLADLPAAATLSGVTSN